ncbi:hypothetical protein F5Y19DRAFT_468804 [Xylariaceae sp. FL1651]|nr:hypothetical protein F5Y19DRAFT_468804 [Xylariaceae sp. FL1651]
MPFSALPPEIVFHIILRAVKVRGIKRAGRLRFVSKSWDAAVLDAICTSRVMNGQERRYSYLPRYFTQRIMGRPRTLSRPLRVIRQIAARIVSHRNPGRGDGDSYEAFRDCVRDLCRSCSKSIGHRNIKLNIDWFIDWFIDVELARLPVEEPDKRPELISPCDYKKLGFKLVLRYPTLLAAYRGNNEIMSPFLGAKWVSDYNMDLRLVPFARDDPCCSLRLRPKPDYWRVKSLPAMVYNKGPVLNAARYGRIDALVYLIGKRMPISPCTPQFAARSRNPDLMRIIIEGSRQQNSNLENEQVVRLLLRYEYARIDDECKA